MSVEVFCVQTFWRASPSRVERGQLHQFGCRERALETGRVMARRRSGVLVFRVQGEPVSGIWQEPQVLARFGDAPARPIAA